MTTATPVRPAPVRTVTRVATVKIGMENKDSEDSGGGTLEQLVDEVVEALAPDVPVSLSHTSDLIGNVDQGEVYLMLTVVGMAHI